ncbi:MAG: hypothetical protein EPN91_08325 [Salinibacterium sp.]|nr:MAG: hypothetical protein EPN91_08325 [Salinibacterium sp.]
MPKVTKKQSARAWRGWREVTPGVFVRDDVIPSYDLSTFHLLAALEKDGPPNSMNKYGKWLRSRVAQQILARLVRTFVQPLVSTVYPEMRPLSVRPYGFTVQYDVRNQKRLERDAAGIPTKCRITQKKAHA